MRDTHNRKTPRGIVVVGIEDVDVDVDIGDIGSDVGDIGDIVVAIGNFVDAVGVGIVFVEGDSLVMTEETQLERLAVIAGRYLEESAWSKDLVTIKQ
mmetsp:Transcript_983/g.2025  ORF Transcript_983/g.2025 Transcript_983/m.2025 type:complete len:97 (-) Transcript_983:96-386(-)